MKKQNPDSSYAFKMIALAAISIATLSHSRSARAEQVVKEGAATIEETREGTKVEMSDAEVAELKQWIQNAKYALEQLRDNFRLLTIDEKLNLTREEFKRVVDESGAKGNELYVRYILNRGLLVSDILGNNPSAQEKESLLGLFVESIDLALKHYVDDAAYLEAIGKGVAPSKDLKHIAIFGLEYADRLLAYSQTFLDPRIEYKLTRTAMGLLGNDLNSPRNLDRALFTQEIIKIQQLLKVFPKEPRAATGDVIKDIRRLKYEYRESLRPKLVEKAASGLHISVGEDPYRRGAGRAPTAPHPAPAPVGRVGSEITVGAQVVVAAGEDGESDYKQGVVVGLKDNMVVVKTDGKTVARDKKSIGLLRGCKDDLCVGVKTFNVERELSSDMPVYPVTPIGITIEKKFILRFEGGSLSGKTGGDWGIESLAKVQGCVKDFCVGQKVFNTDKNSYVEIIGIKRDSENTFILKFLDGSLAGKAGGGWTGKDLVHTRE